MKHDQQDLKETTHVHLTRWRTRYQTIAFVVAIAMLAASCSNANAREEAAFATAEAVSTAEAITNPPPPTTEPTATAIPEPTSTPAPTPTVTPLPVPTPDRVIASELTAEGTPGTPAFEAQSALIGALEVFQAAAADPESYVPAELALYVHEGSPLWNGWHAGLQNILADGVAYRYEPERHIEIVEVIQNVPNTVTVTVCNVDATVKYDVETNDVVLALDTTSFSMFAVTDGVDGWRVVDREVIREVNEVVSCDKVLYES